MEPTDRWKAAFLVFGVLIPAFVIIADVVWFDADVIGILVSITWFGFFMLFVEGVKD
jgi:hypothetical protein